MRSETRAAKKVERVRTARPTEEGAGVRLKRAFGDIDPMLDPFLMLDDFHSDDPRDYEAGFPFHPHRGMETVTYMLSGTADHADSLGNRGTIGPGDVQWMTAGSGIIHQEMPRPTEGRLQGLQLWVNLPRESKMMPPRYRDIKGSEIGTVVPSDGVEVKVIAGRFGDAVGPVKDLVVEIEYLDVSMQPRKYFRRPVAPGLNTFAYLIEGETSFGDAASTVREESLVIFGEGDEVVARSGEEGARFVLVSGRPIGEPVAWRGPVVMNTEAEVDKAFRELREGTFVRANPR